MPLHMAPTSGDLSGEAVLAGALAAAGASLFFEALPSTSEEGLMCRGVACLARKHFVPILAAAAAAAAALS